MTKIALATLMTAALLLAACGGGDGGGGEPTPSPTFPPDFTPNPPGLLTPGPAPTPAPGETALVPYTSTTFPYSISIPEGFTTAEGGDVFQYHTADKGLVSEITVDCARAIASGAGTGEVVQPETLLFEDCKILESANAPISSGATTRLTLDGKPAIRWPYLVRLGESAANQFVWYVGDTPCGWRVRMIVYGVPPVGVWETLFNSVAETFRADATQLQPGG